MAITGLLDTSHQTALQTLVFQAVVDSAGTFTVRLMDGTVVMQELTEQTEEDVATEAAEFAAWVVSKW